MTRAKSDFIMIVLALCFLSLIKGYDTNTKPKVLFDISHGQFQDVFVDPSYYDYVLPEYKVICKEINAEYVEGNYTLTEQALQGIKTLVMISPLARST